MELKIILTAQQFARLETLEEGSVLELTYKGLDCYLTPDSTCPNITYKGKGYTFNFYCPSEAKMSVKRSTKTEPRNPEPKDEKAVSFIGAEFDPKKMHPYDVKTHGKHPVHLIEGGSYITEDNTTQFDPCGDMGWFWLNEKEYQYYKSQTREITLKGGE